MDYNLNYCCTIPDMARRHSLERSFEEEATLAGLIVQQPKSIRIDKPVENSGGKKGKVVTTPDFFVINPENGKGGHVEIVNGRGRGGIKPHKEESWKKLV